MSMSISLVAMVVPDYDEAIDFYRHALGFYLVEDVRLDESRRWVVVRPPGKDGSGLLLAKANDERQAASIGNQTGGRVGFFLNTDDFARDHQAFMARGVVFEETPRHEPYGIVAVFRDPFGNRWDLIQHL